MQLELENLLIFEKKMPNAGSQSNIASNAIDNEGNQYNLFISLEPSKTPKVVVLICDQYTSTKRTKTRKTRIRQSNILYYKKHQIVT